MQANVDEVISSLSLLEEELVAHFLSSRLESPLSLSLSLSRFCSLNTRSKMSDQILSTTNFVRPPNVERRSRRELPFVFSGRAFSSYAGPCTHTRARAWSPREEEEEELLATVWAEVGIGERADNRATSAKDVFIFWNKNSTNFIFK